MVQGTLGGRKNWEIRIWAVSRRLLDGGGRVGLGGADKGGVVPGRGGGGDMWDEAGGTHRNISELLPGSSCKKDNAAV